MKQKQWETSNGERMSFGLYALGTILSYYMIMSFLQLFMTDIAIPAATVGLIFIVAKVWDALNDPLFGVIIEKVHLKGGKYKPWVKLSTIAIPVTTILLFIVPSDATLQVKIIWSAVAYILWDTAYTMCDVPMNSLVTAVALGQNERAKIFSLNAFFIYLGGVLVAVVVPMLYPNIGWGTTAILFGIVCFVCLVPINVKAKERHVAKAQEEITVKQVLMSLIKNKYLLIFTAASIIGGIFNFTLTLNGYLAIHCLGGPEWITPLALSVAAPVLVVVLFLPRIFARFGKFWVCTITRIISLCADLCIYLIGYQNIVLFFILIVIKNLFLACWTFAAQLFIADCIEYGQYHSGRRTPGIAFATKAFTNKMVVALTGALSMFGLAAVGFVEGSGVVQSAATVEGIWTLYALFPMIGTVLSLVLFTSMYKLRDKDVQAMTRYNDRDITREEAQTAFTRKF